MKQQAMQTSKCVAIGEIGLDGHYTLSPMPLQKKCFEHFLDIACEVNKPVVVHVRETHREVYERLSSRTKRGLRGVIHCFTGTKDEAKQFLDIGFYISFSGIVTFKNSAELAQTSNYVPLDRLLIETDAPYLAPVPHRGKANEPSFLPATATFLAQMRCLTPESLAEATTQNATALFGLD
jgi:TatD DNase family protein